MKSVKFLHAESRKSLQGMKFLGRKESWRYPEDELTQFDILTGLDGRRSRESCTWQEPCGIHHWWLVDLTKLSPGNWLHEWSGGHIDTALVGKKHHNISQHMGFTAPKVFAIAQKLIWFSWVFDSFWLERFWRLVTNVQNKYYWQAIVMDHPGIVGYNCRALWGDLDQNTWDPSRSLE